MTTPFDSVQGEGVAEEAIRQHKERLAANEAAERAAVTPAPDPEATDVVPTITLTPDDESAPQA